MPRLELRNGQTKPFCGGDINTIRKRNEHRPQLQDGHIDNGANDESENQGDRGGQHLLVFCAGAVGVDGQQKPGEQPAEQGAGHGLPVVPCTRLTLSCVGKVYSAERWNKNDLRQDDGCIAAEWMRPQGSGKRGGHYDLSIWIRSVDPVPPIVLTGEFLMSPTSLMQAVVLRCAILLIPCHLPGIVFAAETKLPGAILTINAAEYGSIQEALDAVPDGGALVQLPAGKFVIEEPLRLHTADTTLTGVGTATWIVNANKAGQPALLIADPECQNAKTDRQHQLWRVQVTNLRITGNEGSGAGIEARQINEILLQGVTVSENGGDGILLDYCYEDPRINACLLTYNKGTGLNLQGCHDIVVAASQFEENQDALHCFDGYNLCMNGCCLDDHLGHGVVIENTYGSVLAGNMIEECNGTAVILDRDCYGITLSANVIAHNGAGIDLRDAHGCAVSANTFTILKTNALRIGPDSGRITVTGNNFSDSYIGEDSVRRAENDRLAGGLLLESTADVAITGNVFSGLTEKAVRMTGQSQRILFQDNVLRDVESDHELLGK